MLGRPRTSGFSISVSVLIKYMLREQRLLFVLIGFAVPALVFNVFHVSTSSRIKHVSVAESWQSTELSRIPRRIAYELPEVMNRGTLSFLRHKIIVLPVLLIRS